MYTEWIKLFLWFFTLIFTLIILFETVLIVECYIFLTIIVLKIKIKIEFSKLVWYIKKYNANLLYIHNIKSIVFFILYNWFD